MPSQFSPAQIDFQALADLPNTYQQGQQIARDRELRNAFSGGLPMANGAVDFNAMAQMIAPHDPVAAANLVSSAERMKPDMVRTWEYFGGNSGRGPQGMPPAVADQFKSKAQLKAETDYAATEAERAATQASRESASGRITGSFGKLKNILTMPEDPSKPGSPQRFSKQDFEYGLGPTVGDESGGYGTLAARRFTEFVEPWMSDSARGTELRDTILGETSAILKTIQPLVRTKGEGSQSDAEFKVIQDLVGNLTKARTPEEYQRRVADIESRVNNLLGLIDSEPNVGASTSSYSEGQTATNPQTGEKIIFRNGQWGPAQ